MRAPRTSRLLLCAWLLLLPAPALALCPLAGLPEGTEVAVLHTPLGELCVELLREDAPLTVDNFLYYLENGLLEDTFFHRSVPGFVLQGGGFTVGPTDYEPVPADPNGPVTNEPCTLDIPDPNSAGQICSVRGNERGTIALAKQSGNASSGTTNWFINLADNRSNLDNQNGGFTVFGRVIGDSMSIVDTIEALPFAHPDDLAWIQTEWESLFYDPNRPNDPNYYVLPTLAPPFIGDFGCWNPNEQATLLTLPLTGLGGLADPVLQDPLIPFTVSTGCGTPIPLAEAATWQPDPLDPNDPCGEVDAGGAATTGPRSLHFPGGLASFYKFTCAERSEILARRAEWVAAFKSHFNTHLVFIEDVHVETVNTIPTISGWGAIVLTSLMMGAGFGLIRRRETDASS